MFFNIRALDLDFDGGDLGAIRYANPSVASQRKRIDGVRHYRSAETEVVLCNYVGHAIPSVIERLADRRRFADSLFDRVDTQVHGAELTSQFPGYGGISSGWQ